ncbi:MAG: hypothetical protein PHW77_07915, partial [Eubacteriales bacterium]|nr:hypothetical protein [Eubacteriales bacterium]
YYGGKESFLNLAQNIEGKAEEIDLLKVGDRYSINVISFGFDSVVAKTISKVKRKIIIGGRNSYATGIVRGLFRGMHNKCVVNVDGETLNGKDMLLCTVANGSHVGGSFKCAPRAKNNDGFIEICLVKPVSVFKFIKLINKYKEGKHLDDPHFKGMLTYRQGKRVSCETTDKSFCISVDGEVIDIEKFIIDIVPKALKFVVPKAVAD